MADVAKPAAAQSAQPCAAPTLGASCEEEMSDCSDEVLRGLPPLPRLLLPPPTALPNRA
jgi:hypothetical protein